LDGQKETAGTSGSMARRDRRDDKFAKVDDFARKINKVTASRDDNLEAVTFIGAIGSDGQGGAAFPSARI
jgi:hypothetical protein